MSYIAGLAVVTFIGFVFALKQNRLIFSPAVCFVGGLFLQAVFGLYYQICYGIDVSASTFLVVTESIVVFLSFSRFITHKAYTKHLIFNKLALGTRPICVVRSKLIIFVLLQLICLCGYIRFMTGRYGNNIADALYTYRYLTAGLGETVHIPSILSYMRGFSSAIGYILSYVLACNLVNRYYRNIVLILTSIVLSIFNESVLGARGGIISFVIGLIMEMELVKYKNTGKAFSFPALCKYVLIATGIVLLFPALGNMIGRPELGIAKELGIYIGAPVINLDTYIKNLTDLPTKHFNTLGVGIEDIENIFRINLHLTETVSYGGWNYINGINLGNVYTIFASFWHDGKNIAVVIYSALMAGICSLLYKKVLEVKFDYKIDFSVIVYAYLVGGIIFSFFSNKFFDTLFNFYTVKFSVCLLLVKFYIEKVKL